MDSDKAFAERSNVRILENICLSQVFIQIDDACDDCHNWRDNPQKEVNVDLQSYHLQTPIGDKKEISRKKTAGHEINSFIYWKTPF